MINKEILFSYLMMVMCCMMMCIIECIVEECNVFVIMIGESFG